MISFLRGKPKAKEVIAKIANTLPKITQPWVPMGLVGGGVARVEVFRRIDPPC
jgi:hypothetical protein